MNKFYHIAFIGIVLGLCYLSYLIFAPFIKPIIWAGVFAIVFYPVYDFILGKLKSPAVSALLTVMICLLLILIPLPYVTYLLIAEIAYFAEYIRQIGPEIYKNIITHDAVVFALSKINKHLIAQISNLDPTKTIFDALKTAGQTILKLAPAGIGNVLGIIFDFALTTVTMFFLLKDGTSFMQKAKGFMPFDDTQKEKITTQVKDIVVSTIYGGVVVASLQGIVGGITYALLGVHSPVLWGFATAVSSFVPLIGTFAIWGPIMLYFFIAGMYLKGLIMLLVGILVISMIDNILRPIIIGSRTSMHVLLIFFSALGGINVFGIIGLIVGPLIVALCISILRIAKELADSSKNPSKPSEELT